MTIQATAPTTRSEILFEKAFSFAIQGKHRDSEELLVLAHEMRAMELRVSHIAQHAPTELALLLVKETMTGFSDDVDPAEYVQANREPIKFYATNDAQVRALIDATLNPLPYQQGQISLSESELQAAREELDRRRAQDPSRITDPTITTACIGIQAAASRFSLTVGVARSSANVPTAGGNTAQRCMRSAASSGIAQIAILQRRPNSAPTL